MSTRIAGILAAALAALISAPPGARADCTCRYAGGAVELGQTVCMKTPQGERLARCDMALNNPSWTFIDAPCPTASLTPPPPRRALPLRPALAEIPLN
jgi:hypothetical protein